MQNLWLLSFLCLVLTGILCIIGALSSIYDDTLWQRIGMAILTWGSFGRATSIWATQYVQIDWFFIHFGLAVFASATAIKCYGAHVRLKRGEHYHFGRRSNDRRGTLA